MNKQNEDSKMVDPITSEQNFNNDKRPFIMVQAYLFGATQRGLMELNADKKQISKLDYSNMKEDVDKQRVKKGNIVPIRCHFKENTNVMEQYGILKSELNTVTELDSEEGEEEEYQDIEEEEYE